MQLMGIDFGTKKVGIALSDESGVMAFPHSVVPNDKGLLKVIEELVLERKIQEIIIGLSLDNSGKPNAVHTKVEEFIVDLTLTLGLPVHLEPEQYSTQQAARVVGKNSQTDAAAAAIILDSYIVKNKS